MAAPARSPVPNTSTLRLEEHYDLFRRLVRTSMGKKIEAAGHEFDDIFQDCCVRVLSAQRSERSRWSPDRGYSISSYLYAVGRHAAANAIRDRRRWEREALLEEGHTIDELAVAPEEEDLVAALDRLVSGLPVGPQRELAILLAEGASPIEVRRALKLSSAEVLELTRTVRAQLAELRE